jgi:hypothetical protein
MFLSFLSGEPNDLHCPIQTADGNWFARIVSSLFLQIAQWLLACQCCRERAEEGQERDGWEPGSSIQFRWHFLVLSLIWE